MRQTSVKPWVRTPLPYRAPLAASYAQKVKQDLPYSFGQSGYAISIRPFDQDAYAASSATA